MRPLQDLIQDTKEFSKEDRAKSWRLLLTSLALWIGFQIVTTLPIHWGWRAAASLGVGLMILRLFMFYHDYLHGAIFKDSPVAEAILWGYGVYVLNPVNVWKRSHNYHHQHNAQMATASIGSFPVMTVEQYKRASFGKRAMYRAARHPITILVGYVTIFIIGMCLKSFLTDPKRHWDSAFALVFHFAMIGVIYHFGGLATLFYLFLFPLAFSCAVGAYLFYIQHNFPGVQMKPREEWDYVFAAVKSSSFMTGSPLTHWLTGNIGYHHVHHLNARIPFYRLPDAMKAIPELRNPITTSLKPADIRKCLQLKLWDPAREEMVSFSTAM